ncbi:MAG: hypothetical protein MJ182_02855 [Treponema sp.]|nr:hypothetical protein [Treponema sp.]
MFKKLSSLGRAVLLTALVLFVSVSVTSCQKLTETPGEKLPNGVYRLEANDPICGEWNGSWGTLLKCTPDFVWATCCSGEKQEAAEGADYTMSGWGGNEYYKKGTPSIYVVYNVKDGTVNKNEGVLLFVAKTSPYGSPVEGCWSGVKFLINADNSTEALIEGGYSDEASYKNVKDLSKAVEMFAYSNKDYYSETNWNAAASGATRKTE